MNAELQRSMAKLTATNDDLRNVLLVTSAPVILVGADGRLRSFSSAAARLFALTPADVGQPVTQLKRAVGARDLEQMIRDSVSNVWANPAFLELFQVRPDIFGRPFEDLWGEQPELWTLLEGTISTGAPFARIVDVPSPGHPHRPMRFSALRLAGAQRQAPSMLLTIEATSEDRTP